MSAPQAPGAGAVHAGADRGRHADRPRDIPAAGWRDIAGRVMSEVREDQVSLLAAGVAFYAMLALVPSLIAMVTVYGLVADPADVSRQLEPIVGQLGGGAGTLIQQQLESVAGLPASGLGLGLAISLGAALWAASSGMQGLIRAVNVAYDERETRGFLKLRGLALLLTVVAVIVAAVALAFVAVLPAVLGFVGLGATAETVVRVLRWPLLALVVMAALAITYRYAPDRDNPRWRWVSWGAVVATALWLIGSGLFSFYVSSFGNYDETYGSLAGVVVLLLWLYLSSFVVLLGAEINAETEHQTARDSTTGPPQPMGQRDAYVADTHPDSGRSQRPS